MNTILLAHKLAPQVDEITLAAGRALVSAHHIDEARSLLQHVAYSPHPSPIAATARKYLDQIAASGTLQEAPSRAPVNKDSDSKN